MLTVRDKLWASAHLKPRVKARLADEKGRLDKEELLGYIYICNNALGRPLLPEGAARDVGQAANNALKKVERLTAEAKAKHSVAISKARAAAKQDPMLVATILEAEEARDAEFKAILAEDYDLQLPNATVGAKRKRPRLLTMSLCCHVRSVLVGRLGRRWKRRSFTGGSSGRSR